MKWWFEQFDVIIEDFSPAIQLALRSVVCFCIGAIGLIGISYIIRRF